MVVRKLSSGQAIANVHIKHCPSSHMQVFEQWQLFRVKRRKLLPECVSTKWQIKRRKSPSSHHSHMWHHSGSSYLDCHLVHPQLPQSAITEVLSMIRNFKCFGQVWHVCKHVQQIKNIMEVERHESEMMRSDYWYIAFQFHASQLPILITSQKQQQTVETNAVLDLVPFVLFGIPWVSHTTVTLPDNPSLSIFGTCTHVNLHFLLENESKRPATSSLLQ